MTYITVFIALVILSSQGDVYYERVNECGEVVREQGLPPRIIEAMIAADFDIPAAGLYFSKDLEKDLDEINNLNIDPYCNHPDGDEICPLDRYRLE